MNNMHLQVRSKVLSSFVIRIPRNGAIGRPTPCEVQEIFIISIKKQCTNRRLEQPGSSLHLGCVLLTDLSLIKPNSHGCPCKYIPPR